MEEVTIASALRRKSRLEKRISSLLGDLHDAKLYYADETPVAMEDIIAELESTNEEVLIISQALQKANLQNGAVGLISCRNLVGRMLDVLRKERRGEWRTRSADDIIQKDNPWYDNKRNLESLEDLYHRLNDELQELNAKTKITI